MGEVGNHSFGVGLGILYTLLGINVSNFHNWGTGGTFLVVLVGLCLGYTALLQMHLPLTGAYQIDGILGVLLGLFAAAQPAANLLDIILFGRYASVQTSLRQAGPAYWGMNVLVLLAAWVVISTSLLRYSKLT